MSRFVPLDLETKDGAALVLRELVEDDAQAVLDCIRAVLVESPFTVSLPEELPTDPEEERRWIAAGQAKGALLLCAEVEGVFGGTLTLEPLSQARMGHVSTLGVSLAMELRGRGVGRALMVAALDWARSAPHVDKVELNCMADNEVGIALYESLGFAHEGVRIRSIQRRKHEYVDDVLMGIWTASQDPDQNSGAS